MTGYHKVARDDKKNLTIGNCASHGPKASLHGGSVQPRRPTHGPPYLLRGLSSLGALRLETIARPNRSLHADAEVTHSKSQSTLPRSEPAGEDLMHNPEVGRPRSPPMSQQNDTRRTLTLAPYAMTCLIGAIHQASRSVPSRRRRMPGVIPTLGGNRAGPHAHAGRAGPWRTGDSSKPCLPTACFGGRASDPPGTMLPRECRVRYRRREGATPLPYSAAIFSTAAAACSAAAFASTSSTMWSTIPPASIVWSVLPAA